MLPFPKVIDSLHERLTTIDGLTHQWRTLTPHGTEMRMAQQSYDEDFLVRMAYNSNAIEGSTLTLAETEVIYEGEFVPGKPGREQIAARGIFEGADFLEKVHREGRPLNEELLKDLHEHCALDLQPRARGIYRMTPAIIRASRVAPADPVDIRPRMADVFFHFDRMKDNLHPLACIPWFHATFENVHPFADGNGRTGRLWMNAQLQTAGYPPVLVKAGKSLEYKAGLEAWQVDGRPENFMGLFLDCVEEELTGRIAFLAMMPEEESLALSTITHGAEALGIIRSTPSITAFDLGKQLGVSSRQAQRIIKALRENGFITRRGSAKKGTWQVL